MNLIAISILFTLTSPQDAALSHENAPPAGDIPSVRLDPMFPSIEFTRPVQITNAGDGTDQLFVVEQNGLIKVLPNDRGADAAAVFLDLTDVVLRRHNEEGLLALAFHPAYEENGRFFVYYSADEPRRGVLSEFTVSSDDTDRADRASERILLEIEQPWGNHNGCSIVFGPDGMLYFSLGDGGLANDPLKSGQDLSTLLGAVMRIDVDTRTGDLPYGIPPDNPFVDHVGERGEIWAYGLRNIWRMSFDMETGDLWGGDVGQNRYEEVVLIERGGNYGWPVREAFHDFRTDVEPVGEMIDPVIEYGRDEGISITGGHVYRGTENDGLTGVYVYADYVSGHIWGLRNEDGAVTAWRRMLAGAPGRFITSFGEDEAGELYVCTFNHQDGRGGAGGRIWKIVQR